MRFYVNCKQPGHTSEKIYITFEHEPQLRSDIPFYTFQMKCSAGHISSYNRNEVMAEIGFEPIVAAIVGSLLFIVDPLLGVIGAGSGLLGIAARESDKVKRFNESTG
jgi:hypothetical protein